MRFISELLFWFYLSRLTYIKVDKVTISLK